MGRPQDLIRSGRRQLNWQDKVYGNTGFKQSYNVGITGGTDATLRYNVRHTRDDEKYIMLNSNYVRDNLSVKMDKKLSNKLKFEFSSRLTRMVIDEVRVPMEVN